MVEKSKKLAEFEKKLLEGEKLSYRQKLKMYDALFKKAVSLGIFTHENIMDGIEVDIKIARAVNGLKG
jgi:hypothetical protein